MATEARVRQATSAARRLQTLHKGEAAYLVLANSDGIDYIETDAARQNIEYLARWSILGVIVTSGADVVWMELLPDHDYPPLTEQEIATAMEWTRDHDPAHYAPEYCAAKVLAFCASRRFDATGPILMGERLIFDPSVPSETDGLLLEMAGALDTTSEPSNSRQTRGKLLHDDGSALKFGKAFSTPDQGCTAERMVATKSHQNRRFMTTLTDKLLRRKLAREEFAL
jgi:hypothetical protein